MSAVVIYKITNLINGKCYVGQTINFNARISQHKSNSPSLATKAIKKYGKNNFTYEKLMIVEDYLADDMERAAIKLYNCMVPFGYNFETGGCKRNKISEETRRKQSFSHIGKKVSEETKQKISIGLKQNPVDRKHTPESKRKLSEAHRGKRISIETRKRMSASLRRFYDQHPNISSQNGPSSKSKTGYKGVREKDNKFEAWIRFNEKNTYIGRFKTAIEAARAYDTEAIKRLGPNTYLNIK